MYMCVRIGRERERDTRLIVEKNKEKDKEIFKLIVIFLARWKRI